LQGRGQIVGMSWAKPIWPVSPESAWKVDMFGKNPISSRLSRSDVGAYAGWARKPEWCWPVVPAPEMKLLLQLTARVVSAIHCVRLLGGRQVAIDMNSGSSSRGSSETAAVNGAADGTANGGATNGAASRKDVEMAAVSKDSGMRKRKESVPTGTNKQ